MSLVEITLIPATPSGFLARWSLDHAPVGEPVTISEAAIAELQVLTKELNDAFAETRYYHDPETLKSWGRQLFDLFWKPVWPLPSAGGAKRLLIRSSDSFFFNLAWELIFLPDGPDLPLGCDADWSILRVPHGAEAKAAAPDPGPLRLLMMVSAPIDQHQLRYEEEEDSLLRATATLSSKVVVLPFGETGGIEELGQLVSQHRPHLVHLTGHGELDGNGIGRFAFENDQGATDSQPVEEIIHQVFRGSAVRCLFLNACQTGKAGAAGLSEQLVKAGVPLVLGWGLPVVDDTATEFATTFYKELAAGKRVPVATAKAREAVWRKHRRREHEHELWNLTFAFVRLYASGDDVDLVDVKAPLQEYKGPQTQYMLLGDDIKGLKQGFIGRRREQQQLIPALRDGDVTFAVLTGIGGAGKSTLATRAVNKLQAVGFRYYAIKVRAADTPARAGQSFVVEKLLPTLAEPFMESQRQLYDTLMDGKIPVVQRVRRAVREWCLHRFVLVLDNIEDALNLETRSIADPDLRAIYEILARDLTVGSRALVTCRYRPKETPLDQPQVRVVALNDIQEADFRKFLRQDEKIDAHLRAGRLTEPLVQALFRTFGGTPGCWFQLRPLLQKPDFDDWDGELPEGTLLEEKRQEYCEKLLLPKLYALLPEISQHLVSRLGLSELPVPLEALATLIDADQSDAAEAIDRAVAYGLAQKFSDKDEPDLYHVPGLIRNWLTDPYRLPSTIVQATHKMLARFWRRVLQDRAEELGDSRWDKLTLRLTDWQSLLNELFACHHHARTAHDYDHWNWVVKTLFVHFHGICEWKMARLLLEEIPETMREATTWHGLATFDASEGNYLAARVNCDKALQMQQHVGDRAGEAASWNLSATIDSNQGNFAAAKVKLERSLKINQEMGDSTGEAANRHELGNIDLATEDFTAAKKNFHKSLDLDVGNRDREAANWHQLARIDAHEKNYDGAREKCDKALKIVQEIRNRAAEAACWHQLGSIDLDQGKHASAKENLSKSLRINQAIGNIAGEASNIYQLGMIAWTTGIQLQAIPLVVVSFVLLKRIEDGNVKRVANKLAAMLEELALSNEQQKLLGQTAWASYQIDGGFALLREAFGPET